MENKTQKRILLLITNGFAATNVIHSGLIKKLAGKYEIYLLSDLVDDEDLREINRHYGINVRRFDFEIPFETGFLRLLRKVQKALFFNHFRIETQIIKEKTQKGFSKHIVRFVLTLLQILGLSSILLKAIRSLIIHLCQFSVEEIGNFYFQGVISSSPLDIRENMIVNSLSQNVRSLAMVISWDNLTSKGLINANHDYVLVWNKFMAAEYFKFYSDYKSDTNVCITGVPRFDLYFAQKPEKKSVRTEIRPAHKVILFATGAAKHFPEQPDIVRHLIEYGKTHTEIFILVRCHPGDDANLYKPFENTKNIRIWFPCQEDPTKMPHINTLRSLSQMLQSCVACVQVASTMRLDAAACNKSVISIAYDGNRVKPYQESVRRFYDYSHQIPLNMLQIDKMVYSKHDLFSALDDILAEKDGILNQIEAVKDLTHFSEPKSIPAIMNAIQAWLN